MVQIWIISKTMAGLIKICKIQKEDMDIVWV